LLVALGLAALCSSAALAAQGPRPEPAPPGGGGLTPEPVPTNPAPAPPPAAPAAVGSRSSSGGSRPPASSNASFAGFEPSAASAGVDRPVRAKPALDSNVRTRRAARAAARGIPVAKVGRSHVERTVEKVAGGSSPDEKLLLIGGLALLALAVGEALFLTLSVRFLRTTAEP
jgi:hypothetical protein